MCVVSEWESERVCVRMCEIGSDRAREKGMWTEASELMGDEGNREELVDRCHAKRVVYTRHGGGGEKSVRVSAWIFDTKTGDLFYYEERKIQMQVCQKISQTTKSAADQDLDDVNQKGQDDDDTMHRAKENRRKMTEEHDQARGGGGR